MEWIDDDDDPESSRSMEASEVEHQCPYCWQWVTLPIEADLAGELVWDCEVCCRPWLVRITLDQEGNQQVQVERSQD
jgi:hypothetical protein